MSLRRSRAQGATLLEVMIAATIFAILLAIALAVLGSTMTSMATQSARLSTDATSVSILRKVEQELLQSRARFCSSIRMYSQWNGTSINFPPSASNSVARS